MQDESYKVAILIDAENVSHKYIDTIIREASAVGVIKYKRIYGNFASPVLSSWKSVIIENAMVPVHQYNNTTGKNSSDSALIIDAMDLLYNGNIDSFCLVTSDSDFTRLATRLRESEIFVFGMGEQKTAKAFINACNKFIYLDLLYEHEREEVNNVESIPETVEKRMKEEKKKNNNDVEIEQDSSEKNVQVELLMSEKENSGANVDAVKNAIVSLINEKSADDGWLFLGFLGSLLNQRFPDFDVRNFGYKKFVPFIESLYVFEIEKRVSNEDKNVEHVYIRNKEKVL
ncbi:NYN domain-containing protein [Clostridium aminobutyricum]|uniref:NYN domain-containing protein n=1 Tax=Clostridium aminobutyricum TaxID=33953 RepID=A0A939D7N0_CLOAM|nr:NYN domain-containing protein [Clostridium aminobutyricum]MBN7772606.1 NYN domain-containing protein [Clostridium aminobutyricum]